MTGCAHTVLLRSDGSAVAVGENAVGQCDVPALDVTGMAYAQVSACGEHTVLLRSDGSVVAIGDNCLRQCNIPALDEGMAYAQDSAGGFHTVLLRSDGSVVAIGDNSTSQCNIPALDEGIALATGGSFSPAALHSAQNLDVADTCIWPGCHDVGSFDHIAWSCPCRPCNMDIPPKPGEFLVARFGWVISRVDADMDRVHAWLVFVQRTIWELRHGS